MARTAKNASAPHEVVFSRLSLSVRWSTVLLPFEQVRLLPLLETEGYVVGRQLSTPGLLAEAEASGEIGRKGGSVLRLNLDRLTLSLDSSSPESLVAEFDLVEEMLGRGLGFNSSEHAHFYELLVNAIVSLDRSAIDLMRSTSLSPDLCKPLSVVFGTASLRNVALKLVSPDGTAHGPDWREFLIEPSFRGQGGLRVNTVYRSVERGPVVALAASIKDVVLRAVGVLEGLND